MNRRKHTISLSVSLSSIAMAATIATCFDDRYLDVLQPKNTPQYSSARGDTCPPDECGSNGTVLALPWPNIALGAVSTSHEVAVIELEAADGGRFDLDIVDGQFVGVAKDTGQRSLVGAQVTGSIIHITGGQIANDAPAHFIVDEVSFIGSFSRSLSRSGDTTPVYHLSYVGGHQGIEAAQPLCASGVILSKSSELYDHETLAVSNTGGRQYWTLACADHMLGKLERMGYGSDHVTTDARTATLRMLRADYCGTGQAFTEDGTPLYWQNRAGDISHGAPPAAHIAADMEHVEAGWDQHGATCLNTPRLHNTYARADIEAACGRPLPRCTADVLAASEWTTWHP